MSLCYDFQKWTIISILSVAISLTVGLVLMPQVFAMSQSEIDEAIQYAYNYCITHMPDNYTEYQKGWYQYGCKLAQDALVKQLQLTERN